MGRFSGRPADRWGPARRQPGRRLLYPRRAPMASDTGSSSLLIVRAATAAVLSFALLLPANAQFWGNSWGGRQLQPQQRYNPYAQQPYNPYGGFGGDRQWGYGGYPQRERSSSPRQRERPREVEKE